MIDLPLMATVAGVLGAGFGLAADRLSGRWPEHEPGTVTRGIGWRTGVLIATGGIVGAALVLRWQDPRDVLILAVYFAALIVLLATDLDQRLLPDLITLPLIAFTLVVLLLGWSPMLRDDPAGLINGIVAGLGAPLFLFVTDLVFRGALGLGDVKLAFSLGFMSGISRLFTGFLLSSVAISLLLVALVVSRRLGMRSVIPYGPILIGAGFLAALLP